MPDRIFAHASYAVVLHALLVGSTGRAQDQHPISTPQNYSTAGNAMITTVHPLATDVGLEVMRNGGNAVDAVVAAALTLGVVDGHNSGIGGGCFLLIRSPDGKLTAIDGREMAGSRATHDMYLRDGKGDTRLSQTGPLAVAVPGVIAALEKALKLHGSRDLATLIRPAAQIAEEGFVVDRVLAQNLREQGAVLATFPGSRAALLKPDGAPYAEGDLLKQPDLAHTYIRIAEQGSEWFYRGGFAQQVSDWMQAHGGILTAEDFANYQVVLRDPLVTTYRGRSIVGFPPPSSGGLHVAQILGMLENFDLAAIQTRDPGEAAHVIVEAMKLAFADRAYWLGDSDFVSVPRGLVAPEYLKTLAHRIDPAKAISVADHGTPPGFRENTFSRGHTTHLSAVDRQGYWAGMTSTINTSFGSKVIVPGTGVVLNNQMDDFAIQPGVPNAFGLVGAESNSVAPGKRPLSSMSPTLVLQEGVPIMSVGGAGGPKIITEVVLAIIRYIDFNDDLASAVGNSRFHHQWQPNRVLVEKDLPDDIVKSLQDRGHVLEVAEHVGVCQAIVRLADGRFLGVHDPRIPGKAAGFDSQ